MRHFWRIIIEIWRAVKFELLPTFGSLLTIFLATLLPGIVLIASQNLSRVEYELRNNLTMNVFLREDLSDTIADSLKVEFLRIDGLIGAKYVSRDEALLRMKARFGGDILEGLDDNPLPPSFELRVSEAALQSQESQKIMAHLKSFPEVDDVVFAGELLGRLGKILNSVRTLGLALSLLVAFTAIFIVANTVRIAIADRRKTVEIMQLVGATRGYILTPFVLLGGFLGITGAIFSIIALARITDYVSKNLLSVTFLLPHEIVAFILTGLLLGMVGAVVATQKYLKI
jgi:cell division transport system permease protein